MKQASSSFCSAVPLLSQPAAVRILGRTAQPGPTRCL